MVPIREPKRGGRQSLTRASGFLCTCDHKSSAHNTTVSVVYSPKPPERRPAGNSEYNGKYLVRSKNPVHGTDCGENKVPLN